MVVSLFQFDMKISSSLPYLLDIALIFRGLAEISDIFIFGKKKTGLNSELGIMFLLQMYKRLFFFFFFSIVIDVVPFIWQ